MSLLTHNHKDYRHTFTFGYLKMRSEKKNEKLIFNLQTNGIPSLSIITKSLAPDCKLILAVEHDDSNEKERICYAMLCFTRRFLILMK